MHQYNYKSAEEVWLQRPETIQITQALPEQKQPENKNGKKKTVWTFQAINLSREDLDMSKEGKPRERAITFLPIAAQNNTITTKHIKARIDKTQQNSKCR